MDEARIQHYSRPMKITAHLAAWIYLLWVAWQALFFSLPPTVTVDRLGLGALTFLVLCLACTPLNILFNFPPARRLRRMLGLYAFLLACLHLLALLAMVEGWQWAAFRDGLAAGWHQPLGLAAFAILLILAATSFKESRQLLRRYWKRLHRLSYAAGVLGALHLLGAPNAPAGLGAFYLAVILTLLAVRLPPVKAWFVSRRRPRSTGD